MQEHINKLLTTEEIAELLQVHVKTVRDWISNGELKAFNLGKAYRVKESDLVEFLETRKQPRTRQKKQEPPPTGQFKFPTRLLPFKEHEQFQKEEHSS